MQSIGLSGQSVHSYVEVIVLASACHDSMMVGLCCYSIFILQLLFCWPIRVSYIKVIAWLPGIYGNINKPRPQAAPSDSVYLLP